LEANLFEWKSIMNIFIADSPNPLEALNGISEGSSIANIARLIGHKVVETTVRSKDEFKTFCSYISASNRIEDKNSYDDHACLHISSHGDKSGLLIGRDDISWEELLDYIQQFLNSGKNKYDRIITISACHADEQTITKIISRRIKTNQNLNPPKYIFCVSGEPEWHKTTVGWTLFYYFLPEIDLKDKKNVQITLNKITTIKVLNLVYFRWDEETKEYKSFKGKVKKNGN
jgi:hypothetical protein